MVDKRGSRASVTMIHGTGQYVILRRSARDAPHYAQPVLRRSIICALRLAPRLDRQTPRILDSRLPARLGRTEYCRTRFYTREPPGAPRVVRPRRRRRRDRTARAQPPRSYRG